MAKHVKKSPQKSAEGRSKPSGGARWTTQKVRCPEGDYEARLLLEWDPDGNRVLKGISCDNPRFAGLDNCDCKWSCWQKMKAGK
jgi:hypothetical protein